MSMILLRFRGLAVALAVLAISAGAVAAGAPRLTSSVVPPVQAEETPASQPAADEDGDEDVDTDADVDEDADQDTDQDPADAPEADEGGAPEGTHGALVSAAAAMDTPDGFANHGAFVSCVAHMKGDSTGVDLSTVNTDTCAAAAAETSQAKADKANAKANAKAEAGKAKGAAGKAKGAAAKARSHAKP